MFYDKFISLCAQKGESPTQVSKNIGLSNAAATGWKNGKKPNDITIKRLADYFGVPVDALKEPENVFYENYLRLCNSVKKSPSAVALEVGLKKIICNKVESGRESYRCHRTENRRLLRSTHIRTNRGKRKSAHPYKKG